MTINKPKQYYAPRLTLEGWFSRILNQFVPCKAFEYPGLIFYCIDGKIYIEFDSTRNMMWLDYNTLWEDWNLSNQPQNEDIITNMIRAYYEMPTLKCLPYPPNRDTWDRLTIESI